MVTLLQAYERKSDAAAVEEAVFDRRWQMVLDCVGAEDAIFSQGVLVDFRRRLIGCDMDRRLVEPRRANRRRWSLAVTRDSWPLTTVG
jgi:hypothetical protein